MFSSLSQLGMATASLMLWATLSGCFQKKSQVSLDTSLEDLATFSGPSLLQPLSEGVFLLVWDAVDRPDVEYGVFSRPASQEAFSPGAKPVHITTLSSYSTGTLLFSPKSCFTVKARLTGTDAWQGGTKSLCTDHEMFSFSGLASATRSSAGAVQLGWSAPQVNGLIFNVFSGKTKESVSFEKPLVSTVTTREILPFELVGEDLCFVVRYEMKDAPVDKNDKALCVDAFSSESLLEIIRNAAGGSSGGGELAAFSLTDVTPETMPLAGGSTLTMVGRGFQDGMEVRIGEAACASVSVQSPTVATCVPPAQTAAGARRIQARLPNGSLALFNSGLLYVGPPLVQSVSPSEGTLAGGAIVAVRGAGFQPGALVRLGSNACAAVVYVSSQELQCVVPPLSAGAHTVFVTNPDVQSNTTGPSFAAFPAPTLSSLAPASGGSGGGTTLTLTGTGFRPGAQIVVGGLNCVSVSVISDTQAGCVVPAGPVGMATVRIFNTDGQSASLVNAFTYIAGSTSSSLSVTGIDPVEGPVSGGTPLTVLGTGFVENSQISVGGVACSAGFTYLSSNALRCETPVGTAGLRSVVVTNPGGALASLPNVFRYIGAPLVSSLSPAGGPVAGGGTLTVTGSNFRDGLTVRVGSVNCLASAYISPTQASCVVPNLVSSGTYSVRVTNSDSQWGELSNSYAANPAPTLDAVTPITPASGVSSGGTTITLTGTGFLSGATVKIGGNDCASVFVASSTSITCVTPAGPETAVSVRVTNADGQWAQSAGAFTFVAPPSGGGAGGTTLVLVNPGDKLVTVGQALNFTLQGSGPVGAALTYGCNGGTCPSGMNVNAASGVVSWTPGAGQVGTYANVTFSLASTGLSTVTQAITLIVQPAAAAPTVVSVTPSAGSLAGGTNITIVGTGFSPGAAVALGGVACNNVAVVSSTNITCTTAAHSSPGAKAVVVSNLDNQSGSLASGFTYSSSPTISSVSPSQGSVNGSVPITINGTGFQFGALVRFTNATATDCSTVNVVSPTQITCVSPVLAPGTYNVVVTNPDLQQVAATAAFSANPAPTFSSVTPTSGNVYGGTTVTLQGGNFLANPTVLFGGSACTSVNRVSAFEITCVTPAGTTGPVSIQIINADGQPVTANAAFNYFVPPPTLTAVVPNNGRLAGGTQIAVTGTNFGLGSSVTIDGNNCLGVNRVSDTTLVCTTPPGTAGAKTVAVVSGAQTATQNNAFTYNPIPTIVSTTANGVSPARSRLGGGATLTLTGTGFLSGASVSLGGDACTPVTVVSATQITCTIPLAAESGVRAVTVTNQDTQSVTLAGGFTYEDGPSVASVSPSTISIQGGTLLTISGGYFAANVQVSFGSYVCQSPAVNGAGTQITCTTPAAPNAPNLSVLSLTVRNMTNDATATLPNAITLVRTGLNENRSHSGVAANDRYGESLAMVGDVNRDGHDDYVIGAPYANAGGTERGQAFLVSGKTGAILQTWTGATSGERLGWAVAGVGDVNRDGKPDIAISSPWAQGGGVRRGEVRIYSGASTATLLGTTLTGTADDDLFGYSLSGSPAVVNANAARGTVFVGAPGNTAGQPGRVIVRTWNGSNGFDTTATILAPSGGENGARFGWSVSAGLDANRDGRPDVLVGEPLCAAGGTNRGCAYVFSGTADGTSWSAIQTVSGAEDGARLGFAVALLEDIDVDGRADVLLGAPFAAAGGTERGRVFVYGSASPAAPLFTLSGAGDAGRFGSVVAPLGDFNGDGRADFAVGAPNSTEGGFAAAGRVELFSGRTGLAIDAPILGQAANARMGAAAAGANFFAPGHIGGLDSKRDGRPDLVVGQPGLTQGGVVQAGRVGIYFSNFTSQPTVWPTAPYLTLLGDTGLPGNLGISLDGLADYDGDGMLDFAAGEPAWGAHGRVRLYSGRNLVNGTNGGLLRTLLGNDSNVVPSGFCAGQINVRFGWSLRNLPNFQQTGRDMVAVGAPLSRQLSNCANHSGSFFVVNGETGASVFSSVASAANMIHVGVNSAYDSGFGLSLASGDFDKDGRPDLYVGRPHANWATRTGGMWGLSGRLNSAIWSWLEAYIYTWTSIQDLWFATSVAGLGDTDSDGRDDILVGAPGYTVGGQARAGYAGIVRSVPTNWFTPALTSVYGVSQGGSAQANALFGSVLANLGDVNGDEANDFAAGEPGFDGSGLTDSGRVSVYNGKSGALIATLTSPNNGERFGAAIAGVGDLNNDGVADVAIGAPRADVGGGVRAGRVYVYSGASLSATPEILFSLSGQTVDEQFGYSIASLGDFARDGRLAFAVGAPHTTDGTPCNAGWQVNLGLATVCAPGTLGTQPGRVYVFRMPCRIDDPTACQSP